MEQPSHPLTRELSQRESLRCKRAKRLSLWESCPRRGLRGHLLPRLAFDVVVHVGQILDGLHIVGDVGIAVDGVLDDG